MGKTPILKEITENPVKDRRSLQLEESPQKQEQRVIRKSITEA